MRSDLVEQKVRASGSPARDIFVARISAANKNVPSGLSPPDSVNAYTCFGGSGPHIERAFKLMNLVRATLQAALQDAAGGSEWRTTHRDADISVVRKRWADIFVGRELDSLTPAT
jgi:hypothetical protein